MLEPPPPVTDGEGRKGREGKEEKRKGEGRGEALARG